MTFMLAAFFNASTVPIREGVSCSPDPDQGDDMSRTVWVAVDIGCLECHESSAVLGIFGSKEEADSVLAAAAEEQRRDWHGEHSFEAFETALPRVAEAAKETT